MRVWRPRMGVTGWEGWAQWEGSRKKMHVSGLSPGGRVSSQGSKARSQKPHCHDTLTRALLSCPQEGLLGPMGQRVKGYFEENWRIPG